MQSFIASLNAGDTNTYSCIFSAVNPSKTKAGKPYLRLEVYDGISKIQANYWDWAGSSIPESNTEVFDIDATVTSWQGTLQLNIKGIRHNDTLTVSDFIPRTGIDLNDKYKEAYALAEEIKSNILRTITLGLLDTYSDEWLIVPAAKSMHHAFVGGTLVHCLSVAKVAKAIAFTLNKDRLCMEQDPIVDMDLCIAGGLLHDVGKLQGYSFDGASPVMTTLGKMMEHSHLGAQLVHLEALKCTTKTDEEVMQIELLEHIILSHHGEVEYGAAVPPMCLEAYVVSAADGIDAKAQMIIEASKTTSGMLTPKVWGLSNTEKFRPEYVRSMNIYEADDLPFK